MATTVTGPLAAKYGKDPAQFFLNAVKDMAKPFRTLCARMKQRTGIKTFEVESKGKKGKIDSAPSASQGINVLALAVCLWCIKKPAQLVDEAGRMATGSQVGKGLDSDTLDAKQWESAKGLFGVDDAILIGLVPLVVALIGLAGVVLPILIPAAGEAVKGVGDLVGGIVGGDEPAPPPVDLSPPEKTIFGLDQSMVIMIGVAAVAAYFIIKS